MPKLQEPLIVCSILVSCVLGEELALQESGSGVISVLPQCQIMRPTYSLHPETQKL